MKYIDACGIKFEVSVADPILASGNRFGECDVMAAKITINRSCSDDQFNATLIHEWIHAVAGCNGVDGNEGLVSVVAQELYRKGFRVEVVDE